MIIISYTADEATKTKKELELIGYKVNLKSSVSKDINDIKRLGYKLIIK